MIEKGFKDSGDEEGQVCRMDPFSMELSKEVDMSDDIED